MTYSFSPSTSKLAVSLSGGIATLAIDNLPKHNALDLEMWKAIPDIMAALDRDPQVRVVIVRGAGEESFASGADIGEFATLRADAEGGRRYEATNEAAFWAVAHCSKPVIAMIRGFCLGGGFGLALSCDLRVATESAIFGIPAARLGIGNSAMSRQVAELEEHGLIVRRPDPADGRAYLLTLSDEGRERLESVEQRRTETIRQLLSGWDEDRARKAARAIEDLDAALRETAPLPPRATKAGSDQDHKSATLAGVNQ